MLKMYRISMHMGHSSDWKFVSFLTPEQIEFLNGWNFGEKHKYKTHLEYLREQFPTYEFSWDCVTWDGGAFLEENSLAVYIPNK